MADGAGQLEGLTVLIVEDEYLIALEAQRMAEEAGASQVVLANSVEEVRKLLADGPLMDVALLDLKLGQEDATPQIAEIKARNIPVIVATGMDMETPVDVGLLAKPYRETDFVSMIVSALRRTA